MEKLLENVSYGTSCRRHFPEMRPLKFMLILGVVLLHSFGYAGYEFYPPELLSQPGCQIPIFISNILMRTNVPTFFFISAILFFNGINQFTYSLYKRKLKDRVRTLLMPYLIWTGICAFLLFVKHKYFGMSGLGIFLDNGDVDLWRFLKGFWAIDGAVGYPYAFAFWFIRNLMVFALLSPLAWIIGRRAWATALFFILYYVLRVDYYEFFGFQWFVAGCFCVTHSGPDGWFRSKKVFFTSVATFSVTSWLGILYRQGFAYDMVFFIQVIAAIGMVYYLSIQMLRFADSRILRLFINATFMIYATHQCYCTLVFRFWMRTFGYHSQWQPVAAYFSTFITLVLLGVAAYAICKAISPKLLRLLTGGRN